MIHKVSWVQEQSGSLDLAIAHSLQQANYYFALTTGKGFFTFLLSGLLGTFSASGAEALKIACFSTVLTEIAQLIDQIKKQHVKAIFLESMLNPKVSTEITKETTCSFSAKWRNGCVCECP